MDRARVLQIRRMVATLASLGLAAVLLVSVESEDIRGIERIPFAMMLACPLLAAAGIWSVRLGAQLLARGVWWSFLLLGGLISLTSNPAPHHAEVLLATCSGGALLLAGGAGLDSGGGRFQPVAFRGTLLVALVLAIADTSSFMWIGMARLVDGHWSVLLLVPPMLAGIVGLLRLRTWGLFVSLLSNVAVVVLASTGLLDIPRWFRALFAATATLQLLVPAPMLISIARGRIPPPDHLRRAKRVVSAVVIAGIVALSVCGSYLHVRLF